MAEGRLRRAVRRMRAEIAVYRLALKHPRTPWPAKFLLGAAVAYLLSPLDLIPDFIPGLGHLDDVIVVPGLVLAALALVPKDVMAECRDQAQRAHGTRKEEEGERQ